MTTAHPQLDLVVETGHRCPSHVLVLGRTLHCRWAAGHRGDGASLFDFHGTRFQLRGVDVLVTWTDAQCGEALTGVAPTKPHRRRDRRKARLLEATRG